MLYNYKKTLSQKQQENFLKLMDRGVGLVILHHAIYGYRPWPEFQKIVGVTSWLSGTKNNVTMKIHVEDPQHPMTKGLTDFTITGETYRGHVLDPKVHVLLTTDEPSNAKAVAWVHTYRKSPVCYLQLGHGESEYGNPHFTAFPGRAIRWSASSGAVEGPAQRRIRKRPLRLRSPHRRLACRRLRTSGPRSGGRADLLASGNLSDWVEEQHAVYKLKHPGVQTWSLKDGVLSCSGTFGNCGFLRYRPKLADFHLSLEYRTARRCNSGVCIRARVPYTTLKPNTLPSHVGFEVQILDDAGKPADIHSSGAFYGVLAPKLNAARPAGAVEHAGDHLPRPQDSRRAQRANGAGCRSDASE